jgi:energy-coupling factor transporter ATP-binding protein EcfA2
MKPKILILDEPTSLLDPTTAIELVKTLKDLNESLKITVIVVEHRLELLLQIATRLIIMSSGRIVHDGASREVITHEDLPSLGIGVPPVARLHKMLHHGSGIVPLTVDELIHNLGLKTS